MTVNDIISDNKYDRKNILIVLSHDIGAGLSVYVNNVIRIQLENKLNENCIIYTNESYYKNIGANNLCAYSNDDILNMIKNIHDFANITLHFNSIPNFLRITPEELDSFVNILVQKPFIKLIITLHDQFWLSYSDPNMIGFDNYKVEKNVLDICQKMFNRANLIISPTKNILDQYRIKGIILNENSIVQDHSDVSYNNVLEYCPIVDDTFKILFMGSTSEAKGIYLLHELLLLLNNDIFKCKFEIHILGSNNHTNIIKYSNIKVVSYGAYSNTQVFNIINYMKPSMIVLMSIFYESWSFVASIALKTGLPIFYNDIGAYKERIDKLKREYICSFCSKTDKINIIYNKFTKFINKIVANGNHEYVSCSPYEVIATKFYDNLYNIRNFKKYSKNVVVITSKIHTSNNNFSNSNIRSIYTPDERFRQTVDTIISVRRHIPECYIILIDNSEFKNTRMVNIIYDNVDAFLNPCSNKKLDLHTNNSLSKQLGEISQTIYAIKFINKLNINFKNFFKISGRYVLNDNFDYTKFDNTQNIFKKNNSVASKQYFYTCLYKISNKYFNNYVTSIKSLRVKCKTDTQYSYKDFEVTLPEFINYNLSTIDTLGITQNISVRKDNTQI
jgi:hypothetical protein